MIRDVASLLDFGLTYTYNPTIDHVELVITTGSSYVPAN
jgi:hypothetical protein